MFSIRSLIPSIALGALCLFSTARAGDGAHAHHNHAALFGGVTVHDSHVYPTVGLDYERFLHDHFGVVALGELIFGDHLAQIAGLGVAYHPIAPVKIAALGGMEFSDGHNAFLVRGNLEYAIHAGPMSISPSVSVDYVDETVIYVAGAALGIGF